MIVVRCSDETVIAYVHCFPKTLEVGYYLVNVFLGGNALFGGFKLYLLTVLVRACKEHYVIALHSLESDDNILHSIIKRMTHMQLTCNIRWWHNNSKWFLISVYFCMKILLFKPLVI